MAQTNLLFCNIGWMSRYEGQKGKPDKIVGGGEFINEHGWGGEVCNFLGCDDDYVYGFVETAKDTTERRIGIEELGAGRDDEYIDGVTVVWTATDPDMRGRRIVGWYRNARIYRNRQPFGSPPSVQHQRDGLKDFHIRALSRDKILISLEERDEKRFHLGSGKGWMGHTPWWFPHRHEVDHPDVRQFIRRLNSIIVGSGDGDDDAQVSNIESAKNLEETQKKMLLDARIGQGKFRTSLETEWNRACAVTGCDLSELLRASHIKPWKVSNNYERLDRDNGLLLLASLDAAFEYGLISFEDSGKILISSDLSAQTRLSLGIKKEMRLMIDPQETRKRYLKYHREEKFRA